ncbi:hypothetical protein [Vulcanisaeta distributa]|uniref:hypothetical protein n=1 Tax=Vulcanisaeta distributa TaxID=164451 RepID=UPI000A50C911|nr:hypothetical protein [Vulcanisaeta distributa]
MVTNHLWQAIAWALTWPGGESHVRINGLSINDGDVKVKWHLRATDHKGVIKSKAKVVKEVVDLSDDKFLTFLLSAVLGDGSIDAKEKRVWLTIGNSKYELWKGIVDRMRSLSFKERNRNHLKVIKTRPSRAVDLARKWLSNQLIKSLIEDLSLLPDADKLKNLITLAGMRVKPLGRLMIEIIDGIWMNVNVSGSGCVVLRVVRKNREDATAILEKLKNAGYDAELRTWNNGYCVYISYDKLMNYPERIKTALIKKVCEILRKMLDEALNEKNKKRTRAVTKAMANLRCQGTPNISA